jgi:ankyrin repeat protein
MNRCQPCNKNFATHSSLKRHIHAKHPNDLEGGSESSKIHSCPHCHDIFTRRESLRRHIRSKHDGDLSVCSFCLKQFRADYVPQHGPRCARRYWKRVQKHASLACLGGGDDAAHSETKLNTIQLGLQGSKGRNPPHLDSDELPTSEDKDQTLRLVHEYMFDTGLTADALETALLYFEETNAIESYKEALTAAFRLNITFDCQRIRPHKECVSFYDLRELALMIVEVNRDHASINTTSELGTTILHLACALGFAELLEPLFWRGASFDASDEDGLSPLTWAVRSGDLDTVLFALALGADPNLGYPFVIASSAERHDIMEALTKYGADVNDKDCDGNSALEIAINEERLDGVRFLLSLGADANLTRYNMAHPMFRMIKGCEHQESEGCVHGQIASILLEHGFKLASRDQNGDTIVHLAVRKTCVWLLRAALSRNTSPCALDVTNVHGWTALHLAAQKSDIHSTHPKLTIVSMLVEAGSDINSRINGGFTSLHIAAEHGNEALVKLLLDAGVNINTSPSREHSALALAAGNGQKGVARLLIEAGANVNSQDMYGNSALKLAAGGDYVEMVRLLLDAGAYINQRSTISETALFRAVTRGCEEIVRVLLDAGADIDVRNLINETALSLAHEHDNKEIVRLLVYAGASVNA